MTTNNGDDVSTLVTDTGYRIPLTQLRLSDKENLSKVIHEYYTLLKVLPEINQFGEGLESLGVLTMMRKYPHLLQPYFTNVSKKPVNKGIVTCIVQVLNFVLNN